MAEFQNPPASEEVNDLDVLGDLAVAGALTVGGLPVGGPLDNPLSLFDPAGFPPLAPVGAVSAVVSIPAVAGSVASASTRFASFAVVADPRFPPNGGAALVVNGFTNPGGDTIGVDVDTTGTTIGDTWAIFATETATGFRWRVGDVGISP